MRPSQVSVCSPPARGLSLAMMRPAVSVTRPVQAVARPRGLPLAAGPWVLPLAAGDSPSTMVTGPGDGEGKTIKGSAARSETPLSGSPQGLPFGSSSTAEGSPQAETK